MIDFKFLANELRAAEEFASRCLSNLLHAQALRRVLEHHVSDDARDLDTKDEPAPMDTLGSLIDKLITVDLKMWHNQEQLYAIRRMDPDEFVERYRHDLGELHAVVKRCCDLNVQRSRLVDAIDAKLAAVVDGRDDVVTAEAHKTY